MKQTKQYLAARDRFKVEVVARGGTVVGEYSGSKTQVHVKCPQGHDCYVFPSNLTKTGRGMCQKCAGRDKSDAAARFLANAEVAGWTVQGAYGGAHEPVVMICPNGHESAPTPGNFRSGKRCKQCSGNMPRQAERKFLDALAAEGGRMLGEYVNARQAVTCVCVQGHVTDRTPDAVTNRDATCRLCAVRHDVFYIVSGPAGIKFGISSGDGTQRLAVHGRDGYLNVVRVWTGLPGDTAYELETELLRQMALAKVAPVRGREYFPTGVLPVVLATAEFWLD